MESELEFVAPVRIATRSKAPIAPDDVEMEETEEPEPFYSLAFDPGGTTGWSVFGIWPEAMRDPALKLLGHVAFWSAGQFTGGESEQVDQMMSLVQAWPDEAEITSEDFILQQFSMARDLLAPVRMNAKFEDRLYVAGQVHRLSYQMPSMALRSVSDERLKAWGFWNPLKGQQHARDAVKHNITRLRRLKDQFLKEPTPAEITEEQPESVE